MEQSILSCEFREFRVYSYNKVKRYATQLLNALRLCPLLHCPALPFPPSMSTHAISLHPFGTSVHAVGGYTRWPKKRRRSQPRVQIPIITSLGRFLMCICMRSSWKRRAWRAYFTPWRASRQQPTSRCFRPRK